MEGMFWGIIELNELIYKIFTNNNILVPTKYLNVLEHYNLLIDPREQSLVDGYGFEHIYYHR